VLAILQVSGRLDPSTLFRSSHFLVMKHVVADLLLEKYGKKNPPKVKSGDTVRVHQRIKEGDKERVQIFEGLVIATKHGLGLNGSFTVRKIAAGSVGVERTYPVHSPNIVKVERVKTAEVSRAKLYYMRDRLGKAARFRNEERTPETWVEPAAVIPEEVEEAPVEEEVTEEAAEVTPEEVEAAEEVLVDEPKTEEVAVRDSALAESGEAEATPEEAPAAEEAPTEEKAE
jgi:large subunit ribosomal protein L19